MYIFIRYIFVHIFMHICAYIYAYIYAYLFIVLYMLIYYLYILLFELNGNYKEVFICIFVYCITYVDLLSRYIIIRIK